jgi:hypothetical protein
LRFALPKPQWKRCAVEPPAWSWIYLRWFGAPLRFRAAHRAFIMSERLFPPAAVRPPLRFGCAPVAADVLPPLRWIGHIGRAIPDPSSVLNGLILVLT